MKPNFGVEDRQKEWAAAQRTLHGLDPKETTAPGSVLPSLAAAGGADAATAAIRRAEIAR